MSWSFPPDMTSKIKATAWDVKNLDAKVKMSKKPGLSGNGSVAACVHFAAQVLSREGDIFPETLTKDILAPIVVDAHRFGLHVTKTTGSAPKSASVDPRKLLSTYRKLTSSTFNTIGVADVTWDFQGSVSETLEMELDELQSRARGTGFDICSLFVVSSPGGNDECGLVWIPAELSENISTHSMLLYVCPGRVKVVKTTRDLLRKVHEEMKTARERNANYCVWSLISLPQNQMNHVTELQAFPANDQNKVDTPEHPTTVSLACSPKAVVPLPNKAIKDDASDRLVCDDQPSTKKRVFVPPERSGGIASIFQFSSRSAHNCGTTTPSPNQKQQTTSNVIESDQGGVCHSGKVQTSPEAATQEANNNQIDYDQATNLTSDELPREPETQEADLTMCPTAHSSNTRGRIAVAKSTALSRHQQKDLFPFRLYRSAGGDDIIALLGTPSISTEGAHASARASIIPEPSPQTPAVPQEFSTPIQAVVEVHRAGASHQPPRIESSLCISPTTSPNNTDKLEKNIDLLSESKSPEKGTPLPCGYSTSPKPTGERASSVKLATSGIANSAAPESSLESYIPKKSARERVRAKIGAKVWWELEYTARQIEQQQSISSKASGKTDYLRNERTSAIRQRIEPGKCFPISTIAEERTSYELKPMRNTSPSSSTIDCLNSVEATVHEQFMNKPMVCRRYRKLDSSISVCDTAQPAQHDTTRQPKLEPSGTSFPKAPTSIDGELHNGQPNKQHQYTPKESANAQLPYNVIITDSRNPNKEASAMEALSRSRPVTLRTNAWIEDEEKISVESSEFSHSSHSNRSNQTAIDLSSKHQKNSRDHEKAGTYEESAVDTSSQRELSIATSLQRSKLVEVVSPSTATQEKSPGPFSPRKSNSNTSDLPFHLSGRVPVRSHRGNRLSTQKDDDSNEDKVEPPRQEVSLPPKIPPPHPPVPAPTATFIALADDKPTPSRSQREVSAQMNRLNELRQKKLEQLHKARELARQKQEAKKLKESTRLPANKLDSTAHSAAISHVPRVKRASNRQLLQNAIEFTLLAGASMERERLAALAALAESPAENFIVLLKSAKELKFRALYENRTDSDEARRIFSIVSSAGAPSRVTPDVVAQFFKYSSAKKQFLPVDTRSFTVTTDACALMDQLVFKKTAKPRLL